MLRIPTGFPAASFATSFTGASSGQSHTAGIAVRTTCAPCTDAGSRTGSAALPMIVLSSFAG